MWVVVFSLQLCVLLTFCKSHNNKRVAAFSNHPKTTPRDAGRCHGLHAASNNDYASSNATTVSEDDVWKALERLEALDVRLGFGCGASKERATLLTIVEAWEQQQQQQQQHQLQQQSKDSNLGEENSLSLLSNDKEDDGNNDDDDDNHFKYVHKHEPQDRVAIFGGDPSRRRLVVEKKLAPFGSLDQFGTPRDVGFSDRARMLQKIESQQYDVVYIWTRFNCHASRKLIRDACVKSGTTRFVEVESLSLIR
jgi:hypothetical protein